MPFCGKCGSEIDASTKFCAVCGEPVQNAKKPIKMPKFNLKETFNKLKNAISNIIPYSKVNYSSKLLKFAIILIFSFWGGSEIFDVLSDIVLNNILFNSFPPYVKPFASLLVSILLFVLTTIFAFSPLFKKLRTKISNLNPDRLKVIWGTLLICLLMLFFVPKIYEYILFSYIISSIIRFLFLLFTILILFSKRSNNLIFTAFSLIVYLLSSLTSTFVNLNFWFTCFDPYLQSYFTPDYFDYINVIKYLCLDFLIMFVLLFISRHFISKNVGKYISTLAAIPVLLVQFSSYLHSLGNLEDFSLNSFFEFVYIIIFFVSVLLLCFAIYQPECAVCSGSIKINKKCCKCDNSIEDKKSDNQYKKISILKKSILVTSISVTTALVYLITSGVISGVYIKSNIRYWTSNVSKYHNLDEVEKEINKYDVVAFSKPMLTNEEIEDFNTIKNNMKYIKRIDACYRAYINDITFDEDLSNDFSLITVNDSWATNHILRNYYDRYMSMLPSEDDVSVTTSFSMNEITFTVTNESSLPIESCDITCDFTIMYYTLSSYSPVEYGRGQESVLVENLGGNETRTVSISYHADDYYDGWQSYVTHQPYQCDTSFSVTV